MEAFVAFLQNNGLTGVALAAAWILLKYYVGSDIKTTKQGIVDNAKLYGELRQYVEGCEAEIEKRFLLLEGEFKVNKAEQASGLALIQSSLTNINLTIQKHIDREQIYQDKVDKFMGYAYRKLGNGHDTSEE